MVEDCTKKTDGDLVAAGFCCCAFCALLLCGEEGKPIAMAQSPILIQHTPHQRKLLILKCVHRRRD